MYSGQESFQYLIAKLSPSQLGAIETVRMDPKCFKDAFDAIANFWAGESVASYDTLRPFEKLTGLRRVLIERGIVGRRSWRPQKVHSRANEVP